MKPKIKLLSEKKLIGMSTKTSLSNDKTFQLWSSFMPRRKEIKNAIGTDFYSLQTYGKELSSNTFTPSTVFEKWAIVEVKGFKNTPEGMQTFVLESGLYAVFIHKGLASDFPKTLGFIFEKWLPASPYILDNRPHFEVLGAKYKRNDKESEEEVWIPIKGR